MLWLKCSNNFMKMTQEHEYFEGPVEETWHEEKVLFVTIV